MVVVPLGFVVPPLVKVFSGGVVVSFDDLGHIKGVGLVFGTVPGTQSVPRAEAFAPLLTLQGLNLEGNVSEWHSDASYVVANSRKLDCGLNKVGNLVLSRMPRLSFVSEFETDSALANLAFCRGGYVWLATRVQTGDALGR